MQDFKLYVILDVAALSSSSDIVEITRKLILGGADILQLRAKDWTDRQILEISPTVRDLTRKKKCLFILNDRADLAQIVDADGVHLGQEDLPIEYARKILKKNKLIGYSTHSVREAEEAQRLGADYIGIGPIFPTSLKPKTEAFTPKVILKIKDKLKIPFVAIGGINLNNLERVLASGAKRVAVCQALITAADVIARTKEFRRRLYK